MYGEMDTSAVGGFNTFFPAVLFVIMFLQGTNLINRLLRYCKLDRFQFGDMEANEEVLNKVIFECLTLMTTGERDT